MLEDSYKHIDLASLNSIVTKPLAADLLTQKTKIFTATNASNLSQSHVETKISPENVSNEKSYKTQISGTNSESKITCVSPLGENMKNTKPKRKVGAAVFGSLLLVGSAISAMYLYNPSVPQTNCKQLR